MRRRTPLLTEQWHTRRAVTLVEILVVIIIILILASAVVVVSGTAIDKGKATTTRATMQVVADAVEQFKRDRPIKNRDYRRRFGDYPPDELEVFTQLGVRIPQPPGAWTKKNLAIGGSVIVPNPVDVTWGAMDFFVTGAANQAALEHRDLAAMIVAIETMSETAAAILSRLPDRARSPGPLNLAAASNPIPAIFLDRPDAAGAPDGVWGEGDFQIRYIVDAWGVPLSYLAQRDFDDNNAGGAAATLSDNHPTWNEASTEMIRINRGQPIIFSHGPDGEEQLTAEWMKPPSGTPGAASLTGDFEASPHGKITHHLHQDNVYLDETLTARLAGG